jgi:hypothetical protein
LNPNTGGGGVGDAAEGDGEALTVPVKIMSTLSVLVASVVGRVTVADTVQESGLAKGSVTLSVAGVCAVAPPLLVFVWVPDVHLAVHAKVASPLTVALAFSFTEVGWVIVSATVHDASGPDPEQEADPFA